MIKIPFNKPPVCGGEIDLVIEASRSGKISGDGAFTQKCHQWFDHRLSATSLLTTSCTHALEMSAILINIEPGDEVIMPSYTFVSTANAFALRGAKIVFIDIRPDTMNMNEALIEAAITSRTKAIVPVHYAGVACEMSVINRLAQKHGIYVVEDAAQGMMSTYDGKALGTIGHLGTYSFHETKNFTSGGEGGLLIVNDSSFEERSEIIREKGTNRSKFFRGMIDKYSWVDIGSSYLPSDIQAAYLFAQLQAAEEMTRHRLSIWQRYFERFSEVAKQGLVDLPFIPDNCQHNAHMFYMKLPSLEQRTKFIEYMKQQGVMAVFHYVPLHSSTAGEKFGTFHGEDQYTTQESNRLVRMPMYQELSLDQVDEVCDKAITFLKSSDYV